VKFHRSAPPGFKLAALGCPKPEDHALHLTPDLRRAILTSVLVTLGSIAASIVPTFIWLQIDPVVDHASIYISCIVLPGLIAPTCSYFILRAQMKAERLAQENHRLANRDALTGLPNRRAFFAAAEKLQARAKDGEGRLVCAIADIDNFKRINDAFGHEAGDRVLQAVSNALEDRVPVGAAIARLGGEEFAFAGLFASDLAARRFCDELVGAARSADCDVGARSLLVTISLGYCFAREDDTVSALLSRADDALDRAKREGKNRALPFETGDAARRPGPRAVAG